MHATQLWITGHHLAPSRPDWTGYTIALCLPLPFAANTLYGFCCAGQPSSNLTVATISVASTLWLLQLDSIVLRLPCRRGFGIGMEWLGRRWALGCYRAVERLSYSVRVWAHQALHGGLGGLGGLWLWLSGLALAALSNFYPLVPPSFPHPTRLLHPLRGSVIFSLLT